MKWPKYTAKELLLSATLIGLGLGCIQIFANKPDPGLPTPWLKAIAPLVALLMSGPLLVSGVLLPFHQFRLGVYLGFFGELIAGLIAGVYLIGWDDLDHWSIWTALGLTGFVVALTAFVILRKAFALLTKTTRNAGTGVAE